MRFTGLLGWTAVALLLPVTLSAQAVVAGVVMDTAGKPLPDAEIVALKANARQTSDVRGQFLFLGLHKGAEIFNVTRAGYRSEVFNLELRSGDTLRVGVTLGRDTLQVLPELRVEAPAPAGPASQRLDEIRERMLRSGAPPSALITGAELRASQATRLAPVLIAHGFKARVNARGREVLVCPRQAGRPAIYLDGVLVDGGESNGAKAYRDKNAFDSSPFDLESFSLDEVEAIEVYRTTAERPPQYNQTGSLCVVLIWLRRAP